MATISTNSLLEMYFFRLVLPFERQMKGEEDKPLPPSKPRKPYKRNLDGKVHKTEKKRKRMDREMDSEVNIYSNVKKKRKEICIGTQFVLIYPVLFYRCSPREVQRQPAKVKQ